MDNNKSDKTNIKSITETYPNEESQTASTTINQGADGIQTSTFRLFTLAVFPAVLATLLALFCLRACDTHTDELTTPNPSNVWEEGIRQDKMNASDTVQKPEWLEKQE